MILKILLATEVIENLLKRATLKDDVDNWNTFKLSIFLFQ